VDAETDGKAAYFMINCAHRQHFAGVLEDDGDWLGRIRGLRANASTKSHAELDEPRSSTMATRFSWEPTTGRCDPACRA
jgi:S-methylmethionine-dependent homocysteine/selenocysteine methylase